MGTICSCDDYGTQTNAAFHSNIMLSEDQLGRKDPLIQELCQHLRMINQKLQNNLTAINDFKQLLLQSKEEIQTRQSTGKHVAEVLQMAFHYDTVLGKIEVILAGFDQAKQSIKHVGNKNSNVKSMLDSLEKDLNTLRNKSKRPQIQTSMPHTASMNSASNDPNMHSFNLQLLQSGPTQQHPSGADYISESNSLVANTQPTQFSEEENDIIIQKDKIYKKVNDLFALLKQGEDEAQVQMLNWENFIIQQEKMQKLREEILTLSNQSDIKLSSYRERIGKIESTVKYFSQTCKLISQAFLPIDQIVSDHHQAKNYPNSPQCKSNSNGDGSTTVTTDIEQPMTPPHNQNSGLLHSRRSLSVSSGHEIGGELASSQSVASLASYVNENVDYDETEQSLLEVKYLKNHISVFETKIAKSQKILNKRTEEQQKNMALLSGAQIYEQDIYELDSLNTSMIDFLNNLEISLHKFSFVEEQIENIRQNQSMLDFCENFCNRMIETQLCLHRVTRLIAKCKLLQTHLLTQPQRQSTMTETPISNMSHFKANLTIDSNKEMLIRLNEIRENMQINLASMEQIKRTQINVESHSDLQPSLTELASVGNKCKDANRIITEMTFRYCQCYVIGGSYGRVVHIEPLFQEKQAHIDQLKQALVINQGIIDQQMNQCNQFSNNQYDDESPKGKKQFSIKQEDLSTDHDQIIEAIRKKTNILQNQQHIATDYVNDIEAQLETWKAQQYGQGGSFNVPEHIDEEEQERPVQELILIDRSLSKLLLLIEKLDITVEKNDRLLKKATLKIKSETLVRLSDSLQRELQEQIKQSNKVETKMNLHYDSLKNKVDYLQKNQASADSSQQNQGDLEDVQIAIHMASVQRSNLQKIIDSLKQKDSKARQLKQDLIDTKEEITSGLYKNVSQYLAMFNFQVQERDIDYENKQNEHEIVRTLAETASMEVISDRKPLVNMNKQISNIDHGLQELSAGMQFQSSQMKSVLEYLTRIRENNIRTSSQQDYNNHKQDSQQQLILPMTPKKKPCQTEESMDDDQEVETPQQDQIQNRLIHNAKSDWSSDIGEQDSMFELSDEIDLAIQKCLEDQTSLKKLKIQKIQKGQYLFENKEYTLRLLQGNNLAIRMHAGYIYADCLVHFEEELYKIVK